jgi:hypothetical protein
MNNRNKTNLKKKLNLRSEMLVRLDPVVLDGVNGGEGFSVPPTVITSCTCTTDRTISKVTVCA